MTLRRALLIAAATASIAPVGFAATKARRADGAFRIGGSAALLPVLARCAGRFMERFETWDRVDPSFARDRIRIRVASGSADVRVSAVEHVAAAAGSGSLQLVVTGDPDARIRRFLAFVATEGRPLLEARGCVPALANAE